MKYLAILLILLTANVVMASPRPTPRQQLYMQYYQNQQRLMLQYQLEMQRQMYIQQLILQWRMFWYGF